MVIGARLGWAAAESGYLRNVAQCSGRPSKVMPGCDKGSGVDVVDCEGIRVAPASGMDDLSKVGMAMCVTYLLADAGVNNGARQAGRQR